MSEATLLKSLLRLDSPTALREVFSKSKEELLKCLPDVGWKTSPYHHQAAIFCWGLTRGTKKLSIFADIGTGKTLLGIYLAMLWGLKRVLICAPLSVIRVWGEQIEEHTNETFTVLEASTDIKKSVLFNPTSRFTIVNYECLKNVFGDKEKKIGEPGSEYSISVEKLNSLPDFDMVILDESQWVKNSKALMTKAAYGLTNKSQATLILTGTPVCKDERDLWSQYFALDNGKTLGTSEIWFLRRYFEKERFDWKIKPGSVNAILDQIAPITVHIDKESCLDLPPLIPEKRYCKLTKEQQKAYDTLKKDLSVKVKRKLITVANAAVNSQKLSQITGGFLYADNDKVVTFTKNPKLELLVETIEDCLRTNDKVIVFHRFIEEARMIADACRKEGWGFAQLRSEIKDKMAQEKKFKTDSNCRIMIAHPYSGGVGKNWQFATVVIFYSPIAQWHLADQCTGRVHRSGQTKKCVCFDLMAEDTVDEKAYYAQKHRQNISNVILDYLKAVK